MSQNRRQGFVAGIVRRGNELKIYIPFIFDQSCLDPAEHQRFTKTNMISVQVVERQSNIIGHSEVVVTLLVQRRVVTEFGYITTVGAVVIAVPRWVSECPFTPCCIESLFNLLLHVVLHPIREPLACVMVTPVFRSRMEDILHSCAGCGFIGILTDMNAQSLSFCPVLIILFWSSEG